MSQLKKILLIPTEYYLEFPYPQEAGRAVAIRTFVSELTKVYPVNRRWLKYIYSLDTETMDPLVTEYGTSRRPHGLVDLRCVASISGYLGSQDKDKVIKMNTQCAYEIAKDALTNQKTVRAEGALGNSSYLAQYLIPAGFMALDEPEKAEAIFDAVVKTGSRAGKYAIYAGTIALALKFKLNTMPWRKVRDAKKRGKNEKGTKTPEKRLSKNSYGISARKTYLRMSWRAWKDEKRYGLGNFQNVITDYYDEKAKNPKQSIEKFERWSDKAHNEYAEIAACCGTKGLLGTIKFYFGTAWNIKEANVFGAWIAHMVFLASFFRTTCGNIQEAVMSSFARGDKNYNNECIDYVKQRNWLTQVKRWHGAWRLQVAMTQKDFSILMDIDKIEMVGQTELLRSIKNDKQAWKKYKELHEEMIDIHPNNAEMLYRYAWYLKQMDDPKAEILIDRFNYLAPLRKEEF
jgi:hypothetical protein